MTENGKPFVVVGLTGERLTLVAEREPEQTMVLSSRGGRMRERGWVYLVEGGGGAS